MRQIEECRSYVNYLLAEHRQLDNEVRGIQSALRAVTMKQAPPEDLLRRLLLLRDELRRHFTEEEAGGCLEEAVSRCPSVAWQADALQNQHPVLLRRLDHFIGRLQPALLPESREELEPELKQFTRELLAHEAAENQIMRRAFGTMMNGDGDDEE